MNGKQIGAIIGLIFVLLLMMGLVPWIIKNASDPGNTDNLDEGVNIIVDSVIPWWLDTLVWLAGVPGIIGTMLVIGFIFFLKWIGEIGK